MTPPVAKVGGSAASQNVRLFLVVLLSVASLFVGIGQILLWFPDAGVTLGSNKLSLSERIPLIAGAWAGALMVALLSLHVANKSLNPDHARRTLIRLFSPLVAVAFLPLLFVRKVWENHEIAYLVYLMAVGAGLERLIRNAIATGAGNATSREPERKFGLGDWVGLTIVLGLSAYYVARIGTLTTIAHERMLTSSSDLAEYDNLFWNALHGHPFRSPAIAAHLKDWSSLQGHAEFCLYLLLPFYAIAPGATALLWIQTILVGGTAIPVYLLARRRLGALAGVAFAIAMLGMPAVQQPNFYDFHFTAAALFFVAWLLNFLDALARRPTERLLRIGVYIAMACALSCREDVSLGIISLGAFLMIRNVLFREGAWLTGIGLAYFFGVKFGLMPLFGTWWFDDQYKDLKAPGAGGFGSVILTLLSHQAFVIQKLLVEPKLLYFLHMLAPVFALWLRRPILWMAILPAFVSTLLVTNRPPLFQASFQYTYLWVAYVVGAAILAVKRKEARAVVFPLILLAVSLDYQKGVLWGGEKILGGFSSRTFEVSKSEAKRIEDLRKLVGQIPRDASVAATESEGPHVSARLVLFSLKFSLGREPDYLLLSHLSKSEADHLRPAVEAGQYGVIKTQGQFILAKRGADTSKNDALLRRVRRGN